MGEYLLCVLMNWLVDFVPEMDHQVKTLFMKVKLSIKELPGGSLKIN